MAKVPTPKLPLLLSLTILNSCLDTNTTTLPTIAILGIGGKGGHRLASYYHQLGFKLVGYDIAETENTRKLQALGIDITFENPNGEIPADIIIYSFNIPEEIRKNLQKINSKKIFWGIEAVLRELGLLYSSGKLSANESILAKECHIAPLVNIDFTGITFIGVTGTDGKTTTCEFLHHVLQNLGYKTGVISTVQTKIGNTVIVSDPHVTTPSSDEVAAMLLQMKEAHCTHIIIEASSQGLVADRLIGLKFDVITITNVTPEHLDFHKTWKQYLNAKKLLITEFLKPNGIAVLNADDRSFRILSKATSLSRSYSINKKNSYYCAHDIKLSANKAYFKIIYRKNDLPVFTSIPGLYNVSNVLGIIGVLDAIGIELTKASKYFPTFRGVCGRMQIIQRTPFTILVDFAHTPNGLKNALETATLYKKSRNNKVIGIIGCSGSRDHYKRVVMGRIAHDLADITIICPTNPRHECQNIINAQVVAGWKHPHCTQTVSRELYVSDLFKSDIDNRRDAFRQALLVAKPGDVVIATGKGHQNDITINLSSHKWSDSKEFKKLITKK